MSCINVLKSNGMIAKYEVNGNFECGYTYDIDDNVIKFNICLIEEVDIDNINIFININGVTKYISYDSLAKVDKYKYECNYISENKDIKEHVDKFINMFFNYPVKVL